jgi:phosphatidylglycerol lysyltransferase
MRLIVRVGNRLMNSAAMPSLVTQVPESVGRAPVLPREPTPIPVATEADAGAPLWTASAKTSLPLDTRIALLREHGTSGYAYAAAFQPDIERFGDERGFLAYRMVGKTALVLSDPIAPAENRADLIVRFVREKHHVSFWCASRATAEIVAGMGFSVNEMGPENRLDLEGYDFSGRSKRALRQSINRAEKLGLTTRECSFKSLDAEQVNAVSDAWRRTRTTRQREISFLNRPIVLDDEMDVRKFFTFDREDRIVAFSFYDPIYQGGRIIGYCNHIKRRLPETDPLVANAMTCHVIQTLQSEGVKHLLLGISPCADIKRRKRSAFPPHCSWWVRRCFRTGYDSRLINRFVYPLRSLHEHKRQYCGVTEQTFYASNQPPSLRRILMMLRACSIV